MFFGISIGDARGTGVFPYAVLLWILPAPMIIGFWTRNYFVRGIWAAYGWILALSLIAFMNGGQLAAWALSDYWFLLIYPTALTLLMMFSNSARLYFNKTVFKTGAEVVEKPKTKPGPVFQKGQKVDTQAFLDMRMAKLSQDTPVRQSVGSGWALAFWTGGYIAFAGYLLGLILILEIGLMVCVLGFVWGRIEMGFAKAHH